MEDCTEMGHLQKVPSGKQPTTMQSNQGKKAHAIERAESLLKATTVTTQEPRNIKKKHAFMTVRLTDGFIASDQMGVYPRTSTKGNTYICIFYVYDPNYIKRVTFKSRHSSKLLRAYQNV